MKTVLVDINQVLEAIEKSDNIIHGGLTKKITFFSNKNKYDINIYQYKLKDIISGLDIEYVISIPNVKFNDDYMKCVMKLNTDASLGIGKFVNKLDVGVSETDLNYRLNLLLTSYKNMNMINVLTDKMFIKRIQSEKFKKALKHDRLKLYKILIKAFNYEVNRYTRFFGIKKYSYSTSFNVDNFTMLNYFAFEKIFGDFTNCLHLTFNIRKLVDLDYYDKYIRGFNFVI